MKLKDLKGTKLNEAMKVTNRYLVGAIVLALISAIFFTWVYFIRTSDLGEAENFTDIVANGSIEEDVYTSLYVTDEPYVFAEYDDSSTSSKYYFLWTGDEENSYLNIAYLDYETYKTLSSEDITEKDRTIYGRTKRIPSDVLQLAIEGYNELVGTEFLTYSNYYNYIGYMYIDASSDLYDSSLQEVAGMIFAVLAIIYLVIYFMRRSRTNKTLDSRSDSDWKHVIEELEDLETKYYKKLNLYLTPSYIVDFSNGLHVVKYSEIKWMYEYQLKRYGITASRSIIVYGKNKKRISIANMDNFVKRSKKDFTEIMEFVLSKNNDMLVGYNKETKEQAKKLHGIKA